MSELIQQVFGQGRANVGDDEPFTLDDSLRQEALGKGHTSRRLATLARTIERDIVPRLVLARRTAPLEPGRRPEAALIMGPNDVGTLAAIVLAPEENEALPFVESLRSRGMSLEAVCLELLAPTARRLGEYWAEDRCSFTDVTLGVWRLHRLLRDLSPAIQRQVKRGTLGLHALLLPMPGEQHTFGLLMVSEFFRSSGWRVSGGPFATEKEMIGAVSAERFSVVGFSVSSDRHLSALTTGIRRIRRASLNQTVGIMVGGPAFIGHPELVARVGADVTAVDANEAVDQAHQLAATRLRPVR